MQVTNLTHGRTALLTAGQEVSFDFLLPLHSYQRNESIPTLALPAQVILEHIQYLPAELIERIQSFCSHQDLLTLSTVNKAAFMARFDNPRLQQLCFAAPLQLKEFLAHYKNIPKTAPHFGALRVRENFKHIKTLTLVSGNFCSRAHKLFSYLSEVNTLHFHLSYQGRGREEQLLRGTEKLPLKQATFTIDYHKKLRYVGCPLPNTFWHYTTLEALTLRNVPFMAHLPEVIELKKLKSLELNNMVMVVDNILPNMLAQLVHLEKLIIKKVSAWALPEEIGQLKALTSLKISAFEFAVRLNFHSLPASLGQLAKLEKLSIKNIARVKKLPDEMGQLQALKSLQIKDMLHIETLPISLGHLTCLERLALRRVPGIKALPDEIGHLKALKRLEIEGLDIETLPKSLGQLSTLEVLQLYSLPKLNEIPAEIGQLQALKFLKIKELNALQAFPLSLEQLKNVHIVVGANLLHLDIPSALKVSIQPSLNKS